MRIADLTLYSIYPTTVPAATGSPVQLSGVGLGQAYDASSASCRFGDSLVPGVTSGPQSITCQARGSMPARDSATGDAVIIKFLRLLKILSS